MIYCWCLIFVFSGACDKSQRSVVSPSYNCEKSLRVHLTHLSKNINSHSTKKWSLLWKITLSIIIKIRKQKCSSFHSQGRHDHNRRHWLTIKYNHPVHQCVRLSKKDKDLWKYYEDDKVYGKVTIQIMHVINHSMGGNRTVLNDTPQNK